MLVLLIGELAARAGLAPSAIRYYDELGLISPAARDSGRRLFDESSVNRLRAISAAREAGFSLEEIGRLLDSQTARSDEWRSLVGAKIDEVRARIARLRVVERTLEASLDCGCRAWDECPLVVA